MNALIDAHAHLADPAFESDLEAVLARARAAGVARVVTVGETCSDAHRVLELAAQHTMLAPCAGLYPTHLDRDQAAAMHRLIRDQRERLIAIGEVGLDRWMVRDGDALALQRELFVAQVQLAIELDLPLNVHSRSAGRHTIDTLLECGAQRVLMHAYDGRPGGTERGVKAGFYFSVPPSVIRSAQKQKLVRALPLDCLLLETDAPVLGAEPGTRNEPAFLVTALAAVAELKGVSESEVAGRTTANALRLFGDRLSW